MFINDVSMNIVVICVWVFCDNLIDIKNIVKQNIIEKNKYKHLMIYVGVFWDNLIYIKNKVKQRRKKEIKTTYNICGRILG